MSSTTPPIEISRSSASPRNNQSSALTSGLLQNPNPTPNMISEPRLAENRPAASRQDSLGVAPPGARPISVNRRRESNAGAGSLMTGMSWGGISVGSLMQDDIMMGGTSPYNIGSPSFHSSSYFPKMEANFWNNLRCCDTSFADLHELLQHFEDVHSGAPSTFPQRMSLQSGSLGKAPRRKSSNLGLNGSLSNSNDPAGTRNQARGFQSNFTSAGSFGGRANGFDTPKFGAQGYPGDMEPIGEMELDDDDFQMPLDNSSQFAHQTNFGNTPTSSQNQGGISSGFPNVLQNQPQFKQSHPATPQMPRSTPAHLNQPSASNSPNINNASQVTSGRTSMDSEHPGTPHGLEQALQNQFSAANNFDFNTTNLQGLNNDFTGLNFGGGNGNDMIDLCINEPAKALFSENGGIDTSQYPQFGFLTGPPGNDEAARRMQARQLASGRGIVAGEEDRPFKCPVIGCEKAYKNANGLRYHEKHGHSNQKLKQNDDGTFSIVDPLTSIPYPGTIGMEKEKPYRCDVCGKRYKNLNGLKYHRNHSPPCNPDFKFDDVALPDMPNNNGNAVFS